MSTAGTRRRAFLLVLASLALHGAALAAAASVRPPPAREQIRIEVVRRARPPAPEAPRSPPVRALSPPARPSGARDVRPPPAAPAPAPAPTPEAGAPRALPRIGLSLGSTVESGALAVGVGNTPYGKADEVAADPASVRPCSGCAVPAARLDARPRPLDLPRIEYPPRARKDGTEGQVTLVLRVDARGAVTAVRVVGAPTPELGAAAAEGARRFRFSPALLAGEPVETEIRFTYTFLLE